MLDAFKITIHHAMKRSISNNPEYLAQGTLPVCHNARHGDQGLPSHQGLHEGRAEEDRDCQDHPSHQDLHEGQVGEDHEGQGPPIFRVDLGEEGHEDQGLPSHEGRHGGLAGEDDHKGHVLPSHEGLREGQAEEEDHEGQDHPSHEGRHGGPAGEGLEGQVLPIFWAGLEGHQGLHKDHCNCKVQDLRGPAGEGEDQALGDGQKSPLCCILSVG